MNEMTPMTPAEALEFLDVACASVSMGRPAHVKGIQAVQILKQLIPNGNGATPADGSNDSPKQEETEK